MTVELVHAANAVTGESPCWDGRAGMLWWIDIQGQRLLGKNPTSGAELCFNMPSMPGLVALRRVGGLIIGLEDGLYPFSVETGLGERLVAVEAENPATRINDGKPDGAGRLWFGTMDKSGSGAPVGALYRVDPDRTLIAIRQHVGIPNAICFSPDSQRFYFADSMGGTVQSYRYDISGGVISDPAPFAHYGDGEKPDGAYVDADGCVWIAIVNGSRIERRRPDGSLERVIEMPVTRPTMAVLGGAEGRTLFCTSQRKNLSWDQLLQQPVAGQLLATAISGALPDVAAYASI